MNMLIIYLKLIHEDFSGILLLHDYSTPRVISVTQVITITFVCIEICG